MWSNSDLNELVIPSGATSGNRIVIDDSGLKAYDTLGNIYFALPALSSQVILNALMRTNDGNTGILNGSGGITLQTGMVTADAVSYVFGNGTLFIDDTNTLRDATHPDTFKMDAGDPGGYYLEEWALAVQAIAAATTTVLKNMTLATQRTNYPTAMNTGTGIWTPPVNSEYAITLSVAFSAWTAGDVCQVSIIDIASGQRIGFNTGVIGTGIPLTVSINKYLTAGQTLDFLVNTPTAHSTIVSPASYINIRRAL